jgi:large subunit ribosomal protein L15
VRVDELKPAVGSRRPRKRVGRGISAGGGKTAGRGQKGQGSRSSWSLPRGFEGGQMPLTQRVPKLRGFYNRFRVEFQVVNCGKLARFEAGSVVDFEALRKAGLIRHLNHPVKLLAGGGVPPALTIRVNRASQSAIAAMTKAGGTVVVLDPPKAESEETTRRAAARLKRSAGRAKVQAAAAQDEAPGAATEAEETEETEGKDQEPEADEPSGGGQESST